MQQPQHAMIEGQIRPNKVNDERVIAAFEAVPREAFVPAKLREVAYLDEDIEIAPGRYLIEPMVLARLVNEAKIEPGDVVLDVGTGTGYSSAILSKLANVVVAIEQDAAMVDRASQILADLEIENAAVIQRTLCEGCLKQGPFNVIVIAGGVEEIPGILLDQLAEGGRLVTVKLEKGVGRGHVITRKGRQFKDRDFFDAQVPVLPGFEKAKGFQF